VNLDQELELKGTTTLHMYLTVALKTGNVDVSSKIEAILEERGKVNHFTSLREILEMKHTYTLGLYSAVAENFGNIEALETIEEILAERKLSNE
jgi:hypothetical protein